MAAESSLSDVTGTVICAAEGGLRGATCPVRDVYAARTA